MIDALAQLTVNGIALGAAYALAALGFVLVINAVGAVNFAHGDFVMAGGFLAVAISGYLPADLELPGLVVLPLTMLVAAGLGLLLSLIAYFPLRGRPPVSVFISTIAVAIILQHGTNAIFGPAPRAAPPVFGDGQVDLGIASVSMQQVAVIVVAAVLIGAVALVLSRTRFGRRLRAAAQDPEMAEAIGIDVPLMIAVTFALAISLAGATGALLANQFFVSPDDGGNYMLKAYIAVVIGGWGRIHGAVLGALLIGMFEVVVAAAASYVVAEALLYGALLAVLVLRPQGLFGEAEGRRA
ncbi:MAG: branched-chain amino acid ABC transporter permease [Rhodospirillaceae bacterium]|jgi:branched-chain amino acid transport system permease protein|nr:branched-chain amino acid ABC transporter permease [Rhodospirillaceae bacterium]